jgi:hypothetical protein
MKKVIENEKEIVHPLEEVFDIEESTTIVPYTTVKTELVKFEEFDAKDAEIEEQLQDLYDMSLEAFETQQEAGETIEAKFRARNAEVAVQYLKTALEAVREKRGLKEHKDKVVLKVKGSTTTNNNLVVADHNALMEMIEDMKKNGIPIEGEFEEK